ncbi:MAG: acyltransferase [Planctomycetes bacterium]|nr:acyltransferase [Planctomycetota bacterium]
MRSSAYFPTLDGLRAIAILLVLYNHVPQLMGRDDGSDGEFWAASRGAWLGVDLFFVLSGFLITNLLLRDRGQPHALRRFWVRRAFRIFPLAYGYLLVLGLVAICVPGFGELHDTAAFLTAATYTLNFRVVGHGWSAACFSILWSLCVEEHFYFLWPGVALFARERLVAVVVVVLIVGTPLLRAALGHACGPAGLYVLTCCRWDSLAWGAGLALLWNSALQQRTVRLARWLLVPALVLVGFVLGQPVSAVDPAVPPWFEIVGFTGIAAAFTVLCAVALAGGRWVHLLLAQPLLVWIGRVSYGVYIWHVLLAEIVIRIADTVHASASLPLRAGIWFALLLPWAALSHRAFELPVQRLRGRFSA